MQSQLPLESSTDNTKKNKQLFDSQEFEMETTIYNKDSVVDKVVTCATMILGLAMIIGPLWLLWHLSDNQNLESRLGAITGFLVLFTILLSVLTVAKPWEVLAATAAYAAVLMVFMQLGSNNSGSSNSLGPPL